ncbi:hypothetical protein LPTSP3_g30990 [Leptospira kobayashii]|uniref:SEC-C motif domain protein n=1 Tax=Leptospira kobayashii TaxID=1917830 RepID=A0ABN6KHZ1_9LEPT|nr:SEC-C metal-binding domain-containing protein [Leptospira kobayashii]BDA80169.1 hypothetical protein LPTSP3_g30990 [Leptospira kobayashii]
MKEKSSINEIEADLNNYKDRTNDDTKKTKEILLKDKEYLLSKDDQEGLKKNWIYSKILEIQEDFKSAFNLIKDNEFYQGWCKLEEIEIDLESLSRHFSLTNQFGLSHITEYTQKFQKLYPYTIFFSPEILEIEKKCNICDQVVNIRNQCGHLPGNIYNGEMCHRIVTNGEILGIAVVKNPVQKYSVAFLSDPQTNQRIDYYNYDNLKYLIGALSNPFEKWEYKIMDVQYSHNQFKHVRRNDPCPCGSSKKYKACCLLEKGVKGIHCKFDLENPPPKSYPNFEIT